MAVIDVNWRPDRRQLRTFGAACLVVLGGLGFWVYLRGSLAGHAFSATAALRLAFGLWFAAGICGLLGALVPTALRPIYVGLSALALPVGITVSYAMLAVLFYGLFTPVALVFRLVGRDAMCRRLDRGAESYWIRRERREDVGRYFRQS
jgi:hypothetical protein